MKLFLVGAKSPTGKALVKILRERRIRFLAPPEYQFVPENAEEIARMVTEFSPTQLINLADFISGNHGALRKAESQEERCRKINADLPEVLTGVCQRLKIPICHLSNAYVFDGEKKLGYNENDEPNPVGVYGRTSLQGEEAVKRHDSHIILRSGWLFGDHKIGLIKSWIRTAKKPDAIIPVWRRRFSPTYTGDFAAAILAVCQQVDCDANVFGTYHYSGLESRREKEFAEEVLANAAKFDEAVYQRLDNVTLSEREVRLPEIFNSTLSSKKIFDTFGIKQRSWHGHLLASVKTLYDRGRTPRSVENDQSATESSAA